MIQIIRKRIGNISIPFTLKKSSIFHRIADITDNDLLFPGTIIVSPKVSPPNPIINIEWRLVNLTKNVVIEDGIGEKTFENMEPGLYSIEYKPIEGYITPNISVRNLEELQTVVFDATYEEGIIGGGNQTGTINVFMNLIIGGWKIELLDDNNNVLFSIPENGYSHILDYSQSGLPLGKYRITVEEINTPIISPTEIERIKYLTSENNTIDWSVVYDNPLQFQTTLNMYINDSRVKWEIDAKYREDDQIIGIGEVLQKEIFVAEQNESWRLKMPDNAKQFEKYIVRAKAPNLQQSDILFRDVQNNEYRYGYDQDLMKFKMDNPNDIYITVKDTRNIVIPKMYFTFAGKNWINSHGTGDFMQIFNPFKNTNLFFNELSFSVKRYWNPGETHEKQIRIVSNKLSNPIFSWYVPNPMNIVDYFNIGFFKVFINKQSLLTLFYLELNSQRDPIGIQTAYSARVSESPTLVIDVDNNFVPVIDISV